MEPPHEAVRVSGSPRWAEAGSLRGGMAGEQLYQAGQARRPRGTTQRLPLCGALHEGREEESY